MYINKTVIISETTLEMVIYLPSLLSHLADQAIRLAYVLRIKRKITTGNFTPRIYIRAICR